MADHRLVSPTACQNGGTIEAPFRDEIFGAVPADDDYDSWMTAVLTVAAAASVGAAVAARPASTAILRDALTDPVAMAGCDVDVV